MPTRFQPTVLTVFVNAGKIHRRWHFLSLDLFIPTETDKSVIDIFVFFFFPWLKPWANILKNPGKPGSHESIGGAGVNY
jgi:hypothetical protein